MFSHIIAGMRNHFTVLVHIRLTGKQKASKLTEFCVLLFCNYYCIIFNVLYLVYKQMYKKLYKGESGNNQRH